MGNQQDAASIIDKNISDYKEAIYQKFKFLLDFNDVSIQYDIFLN